MRRGITSSVDNIVKLLLANHNLILTGAPGTGKTYLAKQIAAKLIFGLEDWTQCPDFEGRCGFVQFHPSYDYTDFVEGIRPQFASSLQNGDENQCAFVRSDGIFMDFCRQSCRNFIGRHSISNDKNNFANKSLKQPSPSTLGLTHPKKNFADLTDEEILDLIKNFAIHYNSKIIKGPKSKIKISYTQGEDKLSVKPINNSESSVRKINFNLLIDWVKGRKQRKDYRKNSYEPTIAETIRDDYAKNRYEPTIAETIRDDWDPKRNLSKSENSESLVSQSDKTKLEAESLKDSKRYVFIIDEINRGEISKILGELFFAIDPGYRGKKGRVKTQYNNLMDDKDEFKDGFYIPENVYIIGTMNDIDRSVDSFDFAVRRRFAWKEIKAEDTAKAIISGSVNDPDLTDSLIMVMKQVNQALEASGLSSDYHLGGAYFAKISQYFKDGHLVKEAMQLLWNYHLECVINEYFRGLPDAIDKVDKIRNVYYFESKKMINDSSSAVSIEKSSALDELSNNVTDLSLESTDGKSDGSESNDSK